MDDNMFQTYENIKLFLDAAVPLRVLALQEQGGPTSEDSERISKHSSLLGEHGDALMFTSKKDLTAKVANAVTDSIAVLSFAPGGITLFGRFWESKVEEQKVW